MSNYADRLRKERRAELAKRALPENFESQSVVACGDMLHGDKLTSFNLKYLDNALEDVEDALDALDDDDIGEALSSARSAKNALEEAVDSYDEGPKRDGISKYSAETITFNLGTSKAALSHVNDAISALDTKNTSKASSELNDAQEILENAIDEYGDDDYDDVVVRRFVRPFPGPGPTPSPPSPGMAGDAVNLEADTEEFASCTAARKRITRARRSLRKAISSYKKCTTGSRVVYVTPSPSPSPPSPAPAPGPGMQVEIEVSEAEFAGLPPFLKAGIIKGLKKKLAAEKDPKKKAEIQAKIDKLNE